VSARELAEKFADMCRRVGGKPVIEEEDGEYTVRCRLGFIKTGVRVFRNRDKMRIELINSGGEIEVPASEKPVLTIYAPEARNASIDLSPGYDDVIIPSKLIDEIVFMVRESEGVKWMHIHLEPSEW